MVVLSVDIDFFVDPVAHDEPFDSTARLSSSGYQTDSDGQIKRFLEQRCRLDADSPVRGVFIRHHDQAFDVLRATALAHGPVILVHVDAHADLGMGDAGYCYLLSEWLSKPEGTDPERGWTKMNLANWLAFAAAGGFVSRVEFVPREHPPSDLFPYYMNATTPSTATALSFRAITEEEIQSNMLGGLDPWPFLQSKRVVKSVPWRTIDPSSFQMSAQPDFVIVCQSPQFTPASADRVLTIMRNYVAAVDLGIPLTGPLP